jgi:hypothetical protein
VGLDRGLDSATRRTRRDGAPGIIDAMFKPSLPEANRLEDIFAAWVVAAHDARLTWDTWSASATRNRGDAYATYRASLDREEQAAAVLAAAIRNTPHVA